jgi:hypothetical protein
VFPAIEKLLPERTSNDRDVDPESTVDPPIVRKPDKDVSPTTSNPEMLPIVINPFTLIPLPQIADPRTDTVLSKLATPLALAFDDIKFPDGDIDKEPADRIPPCTDIEDPILVNPEMVELDPKTTGP